GYLAAYPALRLRGDFLAIVLIAVGEAGRVFGQNYEPLAGGVFGLPGVPNPFAWLSARADYAAYAILVLAIAAGMYLFAVFLAILGINWQPPFDLNYVRYLVTGLIIVLVLLFRPKGLLAERPVDTVAMRVAQSWKTPATVDEPARDDS